MNWMKRMFRLGMATLLLMMLCMFSSAMAAEEAATVTLNVTNTPVRGDVLLAKTGLQLVRFEDETDAYGNIVMRPVFQNAYLAGAVFELRAAENIVGKEGSMFYRKDDLVETLTTSATGTVKSQVLPLGKYYLKEISAPDGYVFDAAPHPFTLAAVDKKTAIVEVKVSAANTYLPIRVMLRKQKENLLITETKDGMIHQTVEVVPGEGFVFGLYSSDPIEYAGGTLPADTLIETGITDTDGVLTFSGDYPHGEYYVQELAAPDGWVLSDARYRVTITDEFADEHHEVVFQMGLPIHNEIVHADVRIAKTDKTGDATLPGALIEVRNSEGEIICRDYTGEDGYLPAFPAVPGTYTYQEVLAPEGYALDEAEMTFTINEQGEVVGQTTIADEFSRFSIQKVDPQHRPLEGVEYGLFREDGTLHSTAVTDSEGLATFEQIPYGSYTIEEIKQLPGYVKDHTKTPITVDGTFKNPDAPIATLTNCPTELLVQKVDQNNVALFQTAGDLNIIAVVLAQRHIPAFQLAGVDHCGIVLIHSAGAGNKNRVAPIHRVHRDAQGIGNLIALDGGRDVHARFQIAVIFNDDGHRIAGSAAGGSAVDADLIHHAGEGLPLQRVGGDLHLLPHGHLADIQLIYGHFQF